MMIKVLPEIAKSVAQPLSSIDKVSIIGGDASGVSGVSGNVPVLMAQTMEAMKGGHWHRHARHCPRQQHRGQDGPEHYDQDRGRGINGKQSGRGRTRAARSFRKALVFLTQPGRAGPALLSNKKKKRDVLFAGIPFLSFSHSSGSSSHTGRRCKARTMLHCSNSVPSPSHIVAYHSGLRRACVSGSNRCSGPLAYWKCRWLKKARPAAGPRRAASAPLPAGSGTASRRDVLGGEKGVLLALKPALPKRGQMIDRPAEGVPVGVRPRDAELAAVGGGDSPAAQRVRVADARRHAGRLPELLRATF